MVVAKLVLDPLADLSRLARPDWGIGDRPTMRVPVRLPLAVDWVLLRPPRAFGIVSMSRGDLLGVFNISIDVIASELNSGELALQGQLPRIASAHYPRSSLGLGSSPVVAKRSICSGVQLLMSAITWSRCSAGMIVIESPSPP